ncbi:MAG TPA: twin-arginine translocase TatA/TatE family subunit [Acidimicrobiia bacterium]|nr:twin-arginine translocase TatA/TatE family subunit [Acidimicrobiia bacterium]
MGSLSFGEILTIVVIILIVFGPNRLPEFARKVGEFLAKARGVTREFSRAVQAEYGDDAKPLTDVMKEFDGVRKDLSDAVGAVTGSSGSTRAPTDDPSSTGSSDGDHADNDAAITDITASSDLDLDRSDEPRDGADSEGRTG